MYRIYRNILSVFKKEGVRKSVKRKRGTLTLNSLNQHFRSGADVCVGVEAMCCIMSRGFNLIKIITI